MDKNVINQIIQAIMGFLGKNAPVSQPVSAPAPVSKLKSLTKDDLLMGRDKEYASEYTAEIAKNLDKVVIALNKLQDAYGQEFKINSGWRPAAVNAATPGSAAKSKHMEGLAADIHDTDGKIMEWTIANLQLMKDMGIYMEDWRYTPTWTHYQIVPPKSGNRIFIPSAAPASAPNRWIGKFSIKYN